MKRSWKAIQIQIKWLRRFVSVSFAVDTCGFPTFAYHTYHSQYTFFCISLSLKVEEVRVPSIRYPSIYHDPTKISALPEVTMMKPGNSPSVLVSFFLVSRS